jgi:AcrR family transcriptional regulator
MADPRIERTRTHVLTTARSILEENTGEPLTFSRLAEVAQVSRRTLYTHWGTIERVIAETIATGHRDDAVDPAGLTPRQIIRELLNGIRDRILDPVKHMALTSLVNQAAMDDKAKDALTAMGTARLEEYQQILGGVTITHAQFAQFVGPLFYISIILNEEMTDEFVETLVDRGLELLDLPRD